MQGYNQTYTNPVVLGQVMSENDPDFSVFWDQGSGRTAPPSAAALTTGKTVTEDVTVTRLDETVGFIVFEAGHGTIGGVEFEAALGADTVRGVGNTPPYTYTFNTPFISSPSIALLTMAGVDGVNGGWAQVHGVTLATATSLFLSIDEDQIKDPERNHTTEQVGYLVFAGPLVFPPVAQCELDADCDDTLFCNGAETCVAGACQAATPVNCDDGVGCTVDSCNEVTDSCGNVTNDASCNNGLFCDGAETCDAVLDCQAGTPVNCDDGVSCTVDSCNEVTDSCDNLANDVSCDDGLFCNGAETCDAALDCQPGTPVNCDDGVGCTVDSCNEASDSCGNVTNDASCNNGLFCDGAETCDAVLDCQAGTPVNCDDGVGCTVDSCNEVTDSCGNLTKDASCNNGLFCDGAETCDAALDCQPGNDACPGQSCDEAGDTCVACLVDADCDDGLFCDGAETCVAGACQAATPPNCNDGVGCTADSCNEETDSCDNVTNNGVCDNGLFCDGAEICDAALDCQPGTPVNCDDGVGCTVDSCNEVTDSCGNVTNDASCNNGLFCDGAETCDAVLDCQAGTPVNCDDGVGCTVDSCNEASDSCDNGVNDSLCDNGLFCDGAETCDAVLDCQAGTPPNCDDGNVCTDDSCDPTTGCVNTNNTASCDNGDVCPGDECSGGVCVPVQCGCAGTPFTVLASGVFDNKDQKDYFPGGPEGSAPLDDLRTLAEEFELEMVTDDPSFYWEARYEDLGTGTVCDVDVLIQARREAEASGILVIEVWVGGLLETSQTEPVSNLVDDDTGAGLPPNQIIVPVPSVDGVNDMTVRLYVQSGNGKKVWWSYTELDGVNP